VFSLQCFFSVSAVLQLCHTCQIALCTSFVVFVSWLINDDDDDDDDAYGNYEFLYEFLRIFNFEKFVKIRDFFAEVTNSRSMVYCTFTYGE